MSLKRLIENVRWGIKYGLAGAVFLMIIALVLFGLSSPEQIEKAGYSLGEVLLFDLASGIACGLVVGLARPFLLGPISVLLVGFVAAVPVAAMATLVVKDGPWGTSDWVIVLAYALLVGPAVAGMWYSDYLKRQSHRGD